MDIQKRRECSSNNEEDLMKKHAPSDNLAKNVQSMNKITNKKVLEGLEKEGESFEFKGKQITTNIVKLGPYLFPSGATYEG